MEKRDEFTDINALAMLTDKSTLPENSCRIVLRTLHRNGFVVKEVVADDERQEPSIPYGTIESLNAKFERAEGLDVERRKLIDAIRQEWNDIQDKYMPVFNAIATAMGKTLDASEKFPTPPMGEIHDSSDKEVTNGPSDPLPGPDAGPASGSDELSEVR